MLETGGKLASAVAGTESHGASRPTAAFSNVMESSNLTSIPLAEKEEMHKDCLHSYEGDFWLLSPPH